MADVTVVLGLGSNKSLAGNDSSLFTPVMILEKACTELTAVLSECHFSSVYRTKAMYVVDQDDFYNMAVIGRYQGTAESLLDKTQAIEALLGRDRTKEFRNGPRTLDIDIELFGEQTVSTARLEIPHPRLRERRFILEPMLEILSQYSDIAGRDEFAECLKHLPDQGVQLYGKLPGRETDR